MSKNVSKNVSKNNNSENQSRVVFLAFITNVKRYLSIIMLSLSMSFLVQASEQAHELLENKQEAYINKVANNLATFTITRGSRFSLCRDFTAYVNRQPPFYYFKELKTDPLFKDLTLPRLKAAGKEYGIEVVKAMAESRFKASLETIVDEQKIRKLKQRHQEDIDWYNNYIFRDEITFYTANIDYNHSGQKNYLLIEKNILPLTRYTATRERVNIPYQRSYYSYRTLNQDGSYKPPERYKGNDLSGSPFYYRGRFYIAGFNFVSDTEGTSIWITIQEPKVSFATKEDVWDGPEICTLSMHHFYKDIKR